MRAGTLLGCSLALAILAACGGGDATVQEAQGPSSTGTPTESATPTPSARPTPPRTADLDARVAGSGKAPAAGSVEEQVAKIATEFALSGDASRRCALLGSGMASIFGADQDPPTPCLRGLADADRFPPGTGLKVRSIKVRGLNADAHITHVGGHLDGVTGVWQFAKLKSSVLGDETSARGKWKIFDWSVDYLRDRDAATLSSSYVPLGPDDALGDEAVRRCASKRIQALPEGDMVAAVYAQFSYANPARFTVTLTCLAVQAPSDTARLRRAYRFEAARALSNHFAPTIVDCALKLLDPLTDDDLRRKATDLEAAGEFAGELSAQGRRCDGKPGYVEEDPSYDSPDY